MPGRTIFGTDRPEVIDQFDGVTPEGDTIFGYGGDDYVFGLGGNDWLKGGGGADHLYGGADIDTADYGDSTEGVTVTVEGGWGVRGTAEGDVLVSIENIAGSPHDDYLHGHSGDNVLTGQQGRDQLWGRGGVDTLEGGSGGDSLIGGDGPDILNGGDGIDSAVYFDSAVGVSVNLRAGEGFFGTAEGDTLISIEGISGSAYDDVFVGNDADNFLYGYLGDDTLKGFGGADTLNGSGGADTLVGGLDNDTYLVDNVGDRITEWVGQGADEVRASRSYILAAGADIETLRTTDDDGTALINLTGNAIANQQIIGNNTDNILDGGGGVDRLTGRRGSDTYIVDSDSDTITERGGEGSDTVLASASYTLNTGADVETLATTDDNGTAAINLTGNANNNSVRGNNGNNGLNGGGGGRDDMTGRGGQDSFRFDTPLSAGNVDVINDFNVDYAMTVLDDDTIVLDDLIFGALTPGPLAADRFVNGTAALDANDNIIYDRSTGVLLYDADGTGATAAIHFATLSNRAALTYEDFDIV